MTSHPKVTVSFPTPIICREKVCAHKLQARSPFLTLAFLLHPQLTKPGGLVRSSGILGLKARLLELVKSESGAPPSVPH